MFESLGRFVHERRRWVLAGALIFIAIASVWGTQVFGALKGGGFDDPRSGSSHAAKILNEIGPADDELVVLYESRTATVDDPAFRAAVTGTLARLPKNEVPHVTTYWDTRAPALVSADRHATYAAIRLAGTDLQARLKTYDRIRDDLAAPGLKTLRGGSVGVNGDLNRQTASGLARAEMISTPILLILLVVIFGSLVSAVLPLAIGGVAILGAFTVLRLLTLVTDVSTFSINVVTMLGLGLAIDYALFIVTRYREELSRTDSEREALIRTMATAGRTVAFSGITVAIALAGLLFFPQMFLRSMGLGGMAVVLVDMIAALTLLPALLALLGRRVDALRLVRRKSGTRENAGAWYRLARSVMRRPVAYATGSVLVLLVLARRSWASGSAESTHVRCRPAPSRARSRRPSPMTSPTARCPRSTSWSPGTSPGPPWTATSAACARCRECPAWTSPVRAAAPPTSRCARRPIPSRRARRTSYGGSGRCPRRAGPTSAAGPRSSATC